MNMMKICFEYYATSQLILVSLDGTVKKVGAPPIYTSMDPSPDGKYILISSIHRPFSFLVPCGRFPVKVDLWGEDENFLREICDLLLAEDIPITHNSVRRGKLSINWRADKKSTLVWVETQDGGDAKIEISPREIIYSESAEPLENEKPVVSHKLDFRYGYVEQLVASAEAAVEEVIRRGVAHPDKIAVGGHSYGAFMTSNLLAHAPHLFCCGIACSEAYNRTLAPFGFQNEDRRMWDASSTYVNMSPFMSANKIKKPILLIHGEEDYNPGTLTMQSDLFFNPLKGHVALCRLVILPLESHGYAARESVMHVLWETDRWLQKYCLANSSEASEDQKASEENDSSTIDTGGESCQCSWNSSIIERLRTTTGSLSW